MLEPLGKFEPPVGGEFTELERALVRAGRSLTYPATPAITARVRSELTRTAENGERAGWRNWLQPRLVVPVLVAIGLAILLVLAIPNARNAVAQFLGLPGLRIFYVTPTPKATVDGGRGTEVATATATKLPTATRVTPTPTGVALCCEVTLAEAQAKSRFALRIPKGETPSVVYFQDVYGSGQQIVMVFGDPKQPRLTLYQAQDWIYGKLVESTADSQAHPTTQIAETQVHGERALWLSGAPHLMVTLDIAGQPVYSSARTVDANTLAWQSDVGGQSIVYRLETKGTLEEAKRIAESMYENP